MFKQRCNRCDRKMSKDFDFCPYCGNDFRVGKRIEKQRDYGLLGKEDSTEFPNMNIKMPLGLDSLFGSIFKEVEKQFKEIDQEMNSEKKRRPNESGISISISTSTGKAPEIKVKKFGPEFENVKINEAKIDNTFDEEKAKQLSGLPKSEAETKVRRLSNKIIYEISLPGVDNLNNVVINKLENSTEIKAFAKDKAYFKLIPLNFPILNYKLKDGKLILELKPSN